MKDDKTVNSLLTDTLLSGQLYLGRSFITSLGRGGGAVVFGGGGDGGKTFEYASSW